MITKKVECKKCGAILDHTICEYCKTESDYIFMTIEEIIEIQKKYSSTSIRYTIGDKIDNSISSYCSPEFYYQPKLVVLKYA